MIPIFECFILATALISNLLEDEKYQRDAFAAQLIKQDSRHKQICSQVEQIHNELASLTMVEMTKRDLQVKAGFSLLEANFKVNGILR